MNASNWEADEPRCAMALPGVEPGPHVWIRTAALDSCLQCKCLRKPRNGSVLDGQWLYRYPVATWHFIGRTTAAVENELQPGRFEASGRAYVLLNAEREVDELRICVTTPRPRRNR